MKGRRGCDVDADAALDEHAAVLAEVNGLLDRIREETARGGMAESDITRLGELIEAVINTQARARAAVVAEVHRLDVETARMLGRTHGKPIH